MSGMTIFERATKKKLRFQTGQGNLSVEDLWDIDLAKLDKYTVDLADEIEGSTGRSFINKEANADPDMKLRFDIARRIIEVRMALISAAEKAAETKKHKQRLLELIADKENEQMSNRSLEELKAELEAM